jgi:hypothetical protein
MEFRVPTSTCVKEGNIDQSNIEPCTFFKFNLPNFPNNFDHQKAENYSNYFGLSRPFVMAVNGFYALDNKQYDIGVGFLSDTAVDLDDPPLVLIILY